MQLTNILLLAAAALAGSGATAHPSIAAHANHARAHAHLHKRGTLVKAVNPSRTANAAGDAVVASVVSATSDNADATDEEVIYKPFCDGAVSKRATTAQIAYEGNTGTADNYGCNIMEIPTPLVASYEYTLQIKNVASETYEVACFNKIGKTGGINGFFKGMGEGVVLTLEAGASTAVAFQANTQGGCAFGPGSVPTSAEGCYAGSWVEFDWENGSNGGWSGADCSSLVAEDTNNEVYGCRVCDAGEETCSTIFEDGTGINAYTKGTNDLDGVGLNIAPGNVTLFLDVGYAK